MNLADLFRRKPLTKRQEIKHMLLDIAWISHTPIVERVRLSNIDLSILNDDEADYIHLTLRMLLGEAYKMTRTRLPRVLKQN